MAPVRHIRPELSLEFARPALPLRFALHVLLMLLIATAARNIAASTESTASNTTSTGTAATASSTTSTIAATSTSVTSHERLTRLMIGSSVARTASVGRLRPRDGLDGKFGRLGLPHRDRIGNLLHEHGMLVLGFRLRRLRFRTLRRKGRT